MSSIIKIFFLLLFPISAYAHIGSEPHMEFHQGFIHPFTGLDHLTVMLLVGVWSAMNGQKWWLAPCSFATLLLLGAMSAFAGVSMAATELIVAASLLVVGIMVAMQLKMNVFVGATIIGLFALFHGHAHGTELSSYTALFGMVTATMILHLAGLVLGYGLMKLPIKSLASRIIGGGVSLFGLSLLLEMV